MLYYFDNCATTRADDSVIEILNKYHRESYFNPSAQSSVSLSVKLNIERSREAIAKALGAESDEIYFVSGGTEAVNIAVLGSAKNLKGNVVITAAEHSAAYNSVQQLKNRGIEVRIAKNLSDGRIDTGDFLSKTDENTFLAVCMHVNNETGAVNDVRLLCEKIKKINGNTLIFSDGVQAVGKIDVNLKNLGVDTYAFSGHKIHCSKGIGCLYVKRGVNLNPIVFGGGQEKGLRSGTEYVAGEIALSHAVVNAIANIEENFDVFSEYKRVILSALSKLPDYKLNASEHTSPAIMSLSFKNVKGEVLMRMLEGFGIVVGTGSACSSKNKRGRLADAINLPPDYADGVIRISFSKYNDKSQVEYLAEKLIECVTQLRKVVSSGPQNSRTR